MHQINVEFVQNIAELKTNRPTIAYGLAGTLVTPLTHCRLTTATDSLQLIGTMTKPRSAALALRHMVEAGGSTGTCKILSKSEKTHHRRKYHSNMHLMVDL